MGLVDFEDTDHLVVEGYSQGRGAVLRAEHFEVTRITLAKGDVSDSHSHAHDQFAYVLSGRLLVTIGDGEAEYEMGPGQATYNPTGIVHKVEALEGTMVLSFKTPLTETQYEASATLS